MIFSSEIIKFCTSQSSCFIRDVLELTVRDYGRGIPDIDKARQPMFTTGGADRSGMGVTIRESFMTSLRITSQPGKGTTVLMRRRLQRRGGQ